MKTRVAVISIIVEAQENVAELNRLLSECYEYIIGRMGIPYREKKVNLISVAIDAPEDVINALSGKIGRLKGISAKINYSNIISEK
ncbi:MAG: iron-only hydrogenase system regulator [Lachnospiraceae bacterium]|nr:iron-only hydrogenase system regulator [Lachnospiraceae bacterium]